jgi:hypothetical protein
MTLQLIPCEFTYTVFYIYKENVIFFLSVVDFSLSYDGGENAKVLRTYKHMLIPSDKSQHYVNTPHAPQPPAPEKYKKKRLKGYLRKWKDKKHVLPRTYYKKGNTMSENDLKGASNK